MQITAIEPQKRKRNRANIFIDGKFSFSLDHETLAIQRLTVGQQITQANISEIAAKGNFAHWYNASLRLLSHRPRSEKEIRDYLSRKKLDSALIDKIIQKLLEKKLLDDIEFARWFIEQRITFRPKGKKVLDAELRAKGIASDTIDSVLATKNIDEVTLAQKTAAKKLPTLQRFSKIEQKEKLTAFLHRRGFTWETIKNVLSLTRLTNSEYTTD